MCLYQVLVLKIVWKCQTSISSSTNRILSPSMLVRQVMNIRSWWVQTVTWQMMMRVWQRCCKSDSITTTCYMPISVILQIPRRNIILILKKYLKDISWSTPGNIIRRSISQILWKLGVILLMLQRTMMEKILLIMRTKTVRYIRLIKSSIRSTLLLAIMILHITVGRCGLISSTPHFMMDGFM